MSIPLLHRHEEAFDERNELLHAVLGFVSLSQQLAVALEEGEASADPARLGGPAAHRARQDVLDALLGVLSMEQRLTAWIREACARAPTLPRAAPPGLQRGSEPQRRPGLLR